MMCPNPYTNPNGQFFGCGQCWPCRANKVRSWATRIELEARMHEWNIFVTLTHAPESLPLTCGCKQCFGSHPTGTLRPQLMRKFLKDLRNRLRKGGRTFRYFLVGEYGDLYQRPHYHLVIFGLCTLDQHIIEECWPHGFVEVSEYTIERGTYAAGYVSKKLGKASDPELNGRHPVFSRMSLKPGIGGTSAAAMAQWFFSRVGVWAVIEGEPPATVIIDGKPRPLPKYMRTLIRKAMALPDRGVHSLVAQRAQARIDKMLDADLLLPQELKRQALINKTEHLRKRRKKLQQIYAINKRKPLHE